MIDAENDDALDLTNLDGLAYRHHTERRDHETARLNARAEAIERITRARLANAEAMREEASAFRELTVAANFYRKTSQIPRKPAAIEIKRELHPGTGNAPKQLNGSTHAVSPKA